MLTDILSLLGSLFIQWLELLMVQWPLTLTLVLAIGLAAAMTANPGRVEAAKSARWLLAPYLMLPKIVFPLILVTVGLLPALPIGELVQEMLLVAVLFHLAWTSGLMWRLKQARILTAAVGGSQLWLSISLVLALAQVSA